MLIITEQISLYICFCISCKVKYNVLYLLASWEIFVKFKKKGYLGKEWKKIHEIDFILKGLEQQNEKYWLIFLPQGWKTSFFIPGPWSSAGWNIIHSWKVMSVIPGQAGNVPEFRAGKGNQYMFLSHPCFSPSLLFSLKSVSTSSVRIKKKSIHNRKLYLKMHRWKHTVENSNQMKRLRREQNAH